jgi:hypothetical protein
MAKSSEVHVEAALKKSTLLSLSLDEKNAVLEVAFLSIAADQRLGEEEIDAFFRVAKQLFGAAFGRSELDAAFDNYGAEIRKIGQSARLLELAARLTRPAARDQAYKLAYAMALSDLDTNDEEFAFDLELQQSLGITPDWAEALADEVLVAFEEAEEQLQMS